MLITKETDYALRILRALPPGHRRSVPDICREELIPTGFTYKIVRKLAAAGILSVSRGSIGGCSVAADLTALSLLDVMHAIGDDSALSACMDDGYPCAWRDAHQGVCAVHCRLLRVQDEVNELLRQRSVSDLLGGAHRT